jgi:hypothetical protein
MKGTPLPRSGISQTSPASPSILDRIGEIILLSWDFILLGLLSATLLMLIFIDANWSGVGLCTIRPRLRLAGRPLPRGG